MAAVAPLPWWPSPALPPAGLLAPSDNPKPQTLPFLLPPLPAGYPLLPPRGPIVLQLHPHPTFVAEVDRRRSCSLMQLLKDEGAIPSPEDEKRREKVIRELKKIVMHWAKAVAHEQSVPQRLATATVLPCNTSPPWPLTDTLNVLFSPASVNQWRTQQQIAGGARPQTTTIKQDRKKKIVE